MVMQKEIDGIRARLTAAPLSAAGLPEMLDAALDGFEALLAGCRANEDRSVESFAAFAFAAAAAAAGRQIILTAPSLPQAQGKVADQLACVQPGLDSAADMLAGLAGVLSSRLSSAAGHAQTPGDQAACIDGAREAARIRELLDRSA